MQSYHRQRNGSSNGLHRRRKVTIKSYPTYLLKTCTKNPNASKAVFVSILLSWVGFVAVFLSTLPSNDEYANGTMSPLSTMDNQAHKLRALSSFASKLHLPGMKHKKVGSNHYNPHPSLRDKIVGVQSGNAISPEKHKLKHRTVQKDPKRMQQIIKREPLLGKIIQATPEKQTMKRDTGDNKEPIQSDSTHKSLREKIVGDAPSNNAKKRSFHSKTKPQYTKQQSTHEALESSELYVQKATTASHSSFKNMYAFAAVEYFERRTMMNDNDDSIDTYYSLDDDVIRGSEYSERPGGYKPVCSSPKFYRLYKPTCNGLHESVSGHDWLSGEGYTTNNHRSRFLGEGTYRQAFVLEAPSGNWVDEVVFKTMKRFSPASTFEKRIGKKIPRYWID